MNVNTYNSENDNANVNTNNANSDIDNVNVNISTYKITSDTIIDSTNDSAPFS